MPDLADVEAEFVRLIVATLYPNGTDEASILGGPSRVYRGWPSPGGLNSDLLNGVVNVTVVPDTDLGTTTTRFDLNWTAPRNAPTLTATVEDRTVSIAGTATADHTVGVLVDDTSYVYQVRGGDTTAVIAANVAAMIRSTRPVHLSGKAFTIPGTTRLVARVVTIGTGFREVRRQTRDLRIIAWCPSPDARDRTVSVIDHALAGFAFLTLAGDIKVRITYKGTSVYDQAQNSQLYRRDLIYTAEYPTILSDRLPAMLFGDLALNTARFIA